MNNPSSNLSLDLVNKPELWQSVIYRGAKTSWCCATLRWVFLRLGGGAEAPLLPIYMLSYVLFEGVHSLCLVSALAALERGVPVRISIRRRELERENWSQCHQEKRVRGKESDSGT